MKQTIRNSCGTIALIHSILNNLDSIHIQEGILKSFHETAVNCSPEERGKLFEKNSLFYSLHQQVANKGQTSTSFENVNHHFMALVCQRGYIFELDGRKDFPIKHGATSETTFLSDAVGVCKNYMQNHENDIRFTILALVEQK